MPTKKHHIKVYITESMREAIAEAARQVADGNQAEYIRTLIETDLRARRLGGYEPMPGWGGSRLIRTLDSISNVEHDQFLDSLEG